MSSAAEDGRLARLTPKEVACLRLVGQRMSSKEIASELGIAKTSVDTYCNRARAKLEVAGRQEAARLVRAATFADEMAVAAQEADRMTMKSAAAASARIAPLTNATLQVAMALLIATLAYGALMAGLHALDTMKPPDVAWRYPSTAVLAAPQAR
jgi:DNA-binding CsgD family transcriptional regulator